jgi:hypothetical protein
MKLDLETQEWVAEPTLILGSEKEIEKALDDFWNGQHSEDPTNEFDPGELFANVAKGSLESEWDEFMGENDEVQDVT